MMYLQKLAVAVKVNGKVLREVGDTVYIPFGSEYSILIKNLESVKAVVTVAIDGEGVTNNKALIVPPNSSIELEGFIKGSKVSNKFKFIERTKEISNFRGNKVDDGLIRVSFKFEKKVETIQPITWVYPYHTYGNYNYQDSFGTHVTCDNSAVYSAGPRAMASLHNSGAVLAKKSSINEDGITVKGSESDQSFTKGSVNALENVEHVIILILKGESNNKKVVKPLEVATKFSCDTCGKKNKSNNKFCGRCGTALF